MNVEEIAETLYLAHMEDIGYRKPNWKTLSPTRSWNNPYEVAKDEYVRMAKEIYKKYECKVVD